MQHAATDLLRRLRPDNFAAFAELFTAAVLQVRSAPIAALIKLALWRRRSCLISGCCMQVSCSCTAVCPFPRAVHRAALAAGRLSASHNN